MGDAEHAGKRKWTRKEISLAEMEQVVPWNTLLAMIALHYQKVGHPGRQPYALATMLRIHFLQQWYALSDPAMEEALYDTAVMRRFARLGELEIIPDETAILNFRRLLETHDLAPKVLERVNAHLARKGQSLKAGTIVDATIIVGPSSTKNQGGERDPEMHQTKKGSQWYFGMKVRIGVDEQSSLVHHVECTVAKVNDVTQVHKLFHGEEDTVCGDSGYTRAGKREELADVEVAFWIAEKPSKLRAMMNTRERKRRALGALQGQPSCEGGASVPGGEAAVRLHEGALPGAGEERGAGADAIGAFESVDGAAAFVAMAG